MIYRTPCGKVSEEQIKVSEMIFECRHFSGTGTEIMIGIASSMFESRSCSKEFITFSQTF
jgi:hypothetical protein